MKFFGWMQNKLNVNQSRTSTSSSASSHHVKQEPREEFSDWPHALLAIGTFGTTSNDVNKSRNVHEEIEPEKTCTGQSEQEEELSSSDDLENFTPEEVGKLQKELMKILSRTKKRTSDVNRELMKNLPLDRFLNCPSSLEVDRRISNALCAAVDLSEENKDEDIERTINVILGRCKEITIESKKNKKKRDISKTSVSYLLKKIFICTDGFSTAPSPSLRETLPESRMEKLLKMMLRKKINAQASSKPASSTTKRYLHDKKPLSLKSEEDEETSERISSSDGYKWVKTDSDFIVLEI